MAGETITPVLQETSPSAHLSMEQCFAALESRPWFQQTSQEIKNELHELDSKEWLGFVQNLVDRPDKFGDLDVKALKALPHTSYAAMPIFETYNAKQEDETKRTGSYEYFSWKQGPDSGAKGVVFVKDGDKITHVVLQEADKFATAKRGRPTVYDSFGGFREPGKDPTPADVENWVKKNAERELKEELGLEDLKVDGITPLGKVQVDAGQSNNEPAVFAAFISKGEAGRLSATPVNLDKHEKGNRVKIVPIDQLAEVIQKNNDGYFQTSIARAMASGIIPADTFKPKNIPPEAASARQLTLEQAWAEIGKRDWYKKTAPEVQAKLQQLRDEKNLGFFRSLADRPDKIGDMQVTSLKDILPAKFGAIVQQNTLADGKPGTYEYHSWFKGDFSGAKGIVYIRTEGKISHFIVLKSEKFATARRGRGPVYDTVGGFAEAKDVNAANANSTVNTALRELKEELGVQDLKIAQFEDLGRIQVDAGMTNNEPGVFAAVIDLDEAQKVKLHPVNPDHDEIAASVEVVNIQDMGKMVARNNDNFFLAAAARSVAKGIIPIEVMKRAA